MISLADLVSCLKCDWGHNMQEPFHDELAGPVHGQRLSDFYKDVREKALQLPKFGTDEAVHNKDIQDITRLVWKLQLHETDIMIMIWDLA